MLWLHSAPFHACFRCAIGLYRFSPPSWLLYKPEGSPPMHFNATLAFRSLFSHSFVSKEVPHRCFSALQHFSDSLGRLFVRKAFALPFNRLTLGFGYPLHELFYRACPRKPLSASNALGLLSSELCSFPGIERLLSNPPLHSCT